MKKIYLIILIIFLTGCTNYNDISNIAVVSSIGISVNGNNYNVYVKVLSSNQENEENIYTKTCTTIDECFNNLSTELMKRLYLTHMDLLILSNNLAKDNYNQIFNFFLNEKSSRGSFTTIIVEHIDNKILETNTTDIKNMLSLSLSTNGITTDITLTDIIKDILNCKISYVPFIETQNTINVKGYKTIYDENKILTNEESLAINIIKNNIKTFQITIDKNVYKLEQCYTINKVHNDNIEINFYCKYYGNNKSDKNNIENYLTKIITSFTQNNKNNYFEYLLYKYGRNNNNIKYNVNINIDYKPNIGGEIFE